ncbi:MAG: AAA family ATPase, partial [Clostridia bacterium]
MEYSPKQIVSELNKYIIGQSAAKKAVAIALRNRYRRNMLSEELREEITPKNIIMQGPTGVGKTEIARRIAKLVKAPFVKVEATKFTEIGYVGRDVESMIRDLVEASIRLVKNERFEIVKEHAEKDVDQKILNALFIALRPSNPDIDEEFYKKQLSKEYFDLKHEDKLIEIDIIDAPKPMQMMPGMGMEINIS